MCTNCMTTAEAVVAQAALVAYAVQRPVHRALASVGLVPEPDPVAHDVRTVAFLRSLDLDPEAILGAGVVAAAEAWVPQPRPSLAKRLASARPIGSHALAAAQ